MCLRIFLTDGAAHDCCYRCCTRCTCVAASQVPPLTNGVTIPRDVTPERVTTQIIDSSLRVQSEDQIAEEMRKVRTFLCLRTRFV